MSEFIQTEVQEIGFRAFYLSVSLYSLISVDMKTFMMSLALFYFFYFFHFG